MAYVADGEIRIGVIYDAAVDKVYSAVKGQGAFKDVKAIRASAVTGRARAIAILDHPRRTDFAVYQDVSQRLYDLGIDYRRMGAAAIGLVRVADGIADSRRDLSDSLYALWLFVLAHVFVSKPVPTFARHALGRSDDLTI